MNVHKIFNFSKKTIKKLISTHKEWQFMSFFKFSSSEENFYIAIEYHSVKTGCVKKRKAN